MEKNLISVIVPVYNVREYLVRCIESIKRQTYTKIEIIIVDDGSNDGSGELCEEIKKTDKRIKVYHKPNGGLSSARNFGLNMSNGEYIGFVDSDDYISDNMYEVLFNDIIRSNATISCCGCNIIIGGKCIQRNGTGRFYEWNREQGLVQIFNCKLLEPSVCNKLYRKDCFENNHFDETILLNEDIPFNIEMFNQSTFIVFRDECLYQYIKRDNSLTRSGFNEREIFTIETAKTIYEKFRLDKIDVVDASQAYLIRTYISVYNHSLHSKDNYHELRNRIKSDLIELEQGGIRSVYLSKAHKFALILIIHYGRLYQTLEKIRRASKQKSRSIKK